MKFLGYPVLAAIGFMLSLGTIWLIIPSEADPHHTAHLSRDYFTRVNDMLIGEVRWIRNEDVEVDDKRGVWVHPYAVVHEEQDIDRYGYFARDAVRIKRTDCGFELMFAKDTTFHWKTKNSSVRPTAAIYVYDQRGDRKPSFWKLTWDEACKECEERR